MSAQTEQGGQLFADRAPSDIVLEEAIDKVVETENTSEVLDYLRQDPRASRATIEAIFEKCGGDAGEAKRLIAQIMEDLAKGPQN